MNPISPYRPRVVPSPTATTPPRAARTDAVRFGAKAESDDMTAFMQTHLIQRRPKASKIKVLQVKESYKLEGVRRYGHVQPGAHLKAVCEINGKPFDVTYGYKLAGIPNFPNGVAEALVITPAGQQSPKLRRLELATSHYLRGDRETSVDLDSDRTEVRPGHFTPLLKALFWDLPQDVTGVEPRTGVMRLWDRLLG